VISSLGHPDFCLWYCFSLHIFWTLWINFWSYVLLVSLCPLFPDLIRQFITVPSLYLYAAWCIRSDIWDKHLLELFCGDRDACNFAISHSSYHTYHMFINTAMLRSQNWVIQKQIQFGFSSAILASFPCDSPWRGPGVAGLIFSCGLFSGRKIGAWLFVYVNTTQHSQSSYCFAGNWMVSDCD
jgi:hypothetical protein